MIYIFLQLLSLYTGAGILILAYIIVYIIAIVSGSRIVYAFVRNSEGYKKQIAPVNSCRIRQSR
jgi:hypothetical protein